MTKLLTIGQMAHLNNISEQTLRLYDKMGLLSPPPPAAMKTVIAITPRSRVPFWI